MGYRSLAQCVHDLEQTGRLVADRRRDRPLPGSRRDPAPGLPGGGAGGPVPAGQGDGVPDGRQPVRHDRADPVPLPRHPRGRPPAGRAEGQPAGALRASLAVSRRAADGPAPAAEAGPARADPGPHDDDRPAAAAPVVAAATAGRSSRCRRSTPRTPTGPAWRGRTWGCTGSSSRATQYEPNREVGLHYQIHRGIGVHHAAAIRRGEPLRVNVFVGGPPALTVAAVMPLPEGLPELASPGRWAAAGSAMVAPDGGSADARRGRFRDLPARSIPTSASPKGRSATTWAITA